MSQTVIGLDIGTWSVKAAVVESTLRRFSLVDFREHHIPRGPQGKPAGDDTLDATVAATLTGITDRGAIATAVPGHRVLTREVELPFSDPKRIDSVLGFQLDGELPRPIEELVYDYYVMESTPESTKLLCSAVDRRWLSEMLEELKQAQADPKVVSLDSLSYAQLVPHLGLDHLFIGSGPDAEPVALIDIGHMTTSVCFVRDGKVDGVRSIPRAGHQLTIEMMKTYGIEYQQAEQIKHDNIRLDGMTPPGVNEESHDQAVRILKDALQPLLRSLRTTLHAHTNRHGRAVSKAVLFGGTARLPGLAAYLSQELSITVETPHLLNAEWSRLSDDTAVELTAPKAASLALRLAGSTGGTMNFRQGDLAYESDFKALKDKALWLAAIAFVVVALLIGRQFMYKGRLQDNHDKLVGQLKAFTAKILPAEISDFETALKVVSEAPAGQDDTVFPEITAFRAFYEVSSAVQAINEMAPDEIGEDPPKDGGEKPPGPGDARPPNDREGDGEGDEPAEPEFKGYKIELTEVLISQKNGKAVLKGRANKFAALDLLQADLERHRCFRDVKTPKTRKITLPMRRDWNEFDIDLVIDCTSEKADDEKATSDKKAKKAKADGGGS